MRHGFCRVDQRRLAGAIRQVAWAALDPSNRGNINHNATFLPHHKSCNQLRQLDLRKEICFKYLSQLFDRRHMERTAKWYAGIVDQNVNGAFFTPDLAHGSL